MKPLIGIVSGMDWETSGEWANYRKSYVNFDYSESVERANGIPILIPISSNGEVLRELVDRLDGIIVSGGHDVNPLLFDEEPSSKLDIVLDERDFTDMEVIKRALETKKPLLGICRGHQIINSILGGNLYQDLSEAPFKTLGHASKNFSYVLTHTIDIKEGSVLKEIFKDNNKVNSYHHQIINKLGDGLKVTATSKDGVIEAIEKINNEEFILGVQFHPEMLSSRYPYHQEIFNRFIKEVVSRKK